VKTQFDKYVNETQGSLLLIDGIFIGSIHTITSLYIFLWPYTALTAIDWSFTIFLPNIVKTQQSAPCKYTSLEAKLPNWKLITQQEQPQGLSFAGYPILVL